MKEPTKDEISLFKLIAEKYRKEIGPRQYFYNSYLEKIQWSEYCQPKATWAIPLWTISDCLELLREKGLTFSFYNYTVGKYYFEYGYPNKRYWSDIVAYKTPLEACLRAVLAVLVGKK